MAAAGAIATRPGRGTDAEGGVYGSGAEGGEYGSGAEGGVSATLGAVADAVGPTACSQGCDGAPRPMAAALTGPRERRTALPRPPPPPLLLALQLLLLVQTRAGHLTLRWCLRRLARRRQSNHATRALAIAAMHTTGIATPSTNVSAEACARAAQEPGAILVGSAGMVLTHSDATKGSVC